MEKLTDHLTSLAVDAISAMPTKLLEVMNLAEKKREEFEERSLKRIFSKQLCTEYEDFDIPVSRIPFNHWVHKPIVKAQQNTIQFSITKFQFPIKKFKWVGFTKLIEESILISDLAMVGSATGFIMPKLLLMNKDNIYMISGVKRKDINHLYNYCSSRAYLGQKIRISRLNLQNFFSCPHLIMSQDRLYYWKIKRGKFDSVSMSIHNISFFNISGMNDKTIYLGYNDQIYIKGVNSQDAQDLYDYCMKNGARLQTKGQEFKSGSERIIIKEDAVVYNRSKCFKKDTTYIPFDQIKLFNVDGWGKMTIIGNQQIRTKSIFPRDCKQIISNRFKELGIGQYQGESVSPCWLWFSIWQYDRTLLFSEDGIVYSDPFSNRLFYFHYSDIENTAIYRSGLFFRTMCIKATVDSVRKDQDNTRILIKIPNFRSRLWKFFFKKGPIYKLFDEKNIPQGSKEDFKDAKFGVKKVGGHKKEMKDKTMHEGIPVTRL